MQKQGFQPEGFLISITKGEQRALIPIILKEPKDNFRAIIYSNAAPWSVHEIECLKKWLTLVRTCGQVHDSIPVIVFAQFDSVAASKVEGVGQFVAKRMLDMDPPEKRPPPAEYAAALIAEVPPMLGLNKQLDFSPQTLVMIDELLERMKETAKIDISRALLILGAYVGEVFVRNLGGKWENRETSGMANNSTAPLVVSLPNGAYMNPLGKVLKRFDQGNVDSLAYYYQALVNQMEKEKQGK
jgi:hypothetical protein